MSVTPVRAIDRAPQSLIQMRLGRGTYRFDEYGELEKRCTQCHEFWPADGEFFFTGSYPDGLHCYCKACYIERRWPNGRPSTKQANH